MHEFVLFFKFISGLTAFSCTQFIMISLGSPESNGTLSPPAMGKSIDIPDASELELRFTKGKSIKLHYIRPIYLTVNIYMR